MWHWYCVVDMSYPWLSDWTRLQWAMGIAQLEAHAMGESILCVRGVYAALHQGDRTYCLILLLYMLAKFEFGVILSQDAMLACYMQHCRVSFSVV